eukprot:3312682-Pleurochrysis_carterae.AAC.1
MLPAALLLMRLSDYRAAAYRARASSSDTGLGLFGSSLVCIIACVASPSMSRSRTPTCRITIVNTSISSIMK